MSTAEQPSLLTFPCQFPIKIMGLANDAFEVAALGIIHKHFPDLTEGAIQMRPSKQNKYLSLTCTVSATSQEQLDAAYRELTACNVILFVL